MAKVELRNRHLHVVVDPDHGAEIVHLAGPEGMNVLSAPEWLSPLPASIGRSYGNQVLDWLSEYRGGWQELFPNAGEPCDVMGVPLPFHGEVSRAHWDWAWIEQGNSLKLRCPARLPLVIERTMRLAPDGPVLFLDERVSNESSFAVPFLWGHHPAFGMPFAESGARIDLPAGRIVVDPKLDGPAVDLLPGSEHVWPRASSRRGETVDLSVVPETPVLRLCYAVDLAAGWAALRNPARGLGVALAWDPSVFPHLWMWQEIRGSHGFPWYGRGDITALEPHSQWPSQGLAAAHAAGTAHVLEAGGSLSTRLACVLFEAEERTVSHVAINGAVSF